MISLRYNRNDQKDENVIEQSRLGLSTISISRDQKTCRAKWEDEDDPFYNGTVKAVVIGKEKPFGKLKKTASRIVQLRPKQREMRDRLFPLDKGRCVITGETEKKALEAAHIVPSAASGNEVAANAILLRADLHLLFDADLFWFEIKDGEAIVKTSDALSANYREILDGKGLDQDTFARVKAALAARAKLKSKKL